MQIYPSLFGANTLGEVEHDNEMHYTILNIMYTIIGKLHYCKIGLFKYVQGVIMGKTMKKTQKSNSTAKLAEALPEIMELLDRNAGRNGKKTIVEITVKGDSEETLEIDLQNVEEVIKILKLN